MLAPPHRLRLLGKLADICLGVPRALRLQQLAQADARCIGGLQEAMLQEGACHGSAAQKRGLESAHKKSAAWAFLYQ